MDGTYPSPVEGDNGSQSRQLQGQVKNVVLFSVTDPGQKSIEKKNQNFALSMKKLLTACLEKRRELWNLVPRKLLYLEGIFTLKIKKYIRNGGIFSNIGGKFDCVARKKHIFPDVADRPIKFYITKFYITQKLLHNFQYKEVFKVLYKSGATFSLLNPGTNTNYTALIFICNWMLHFEVLTSVEDGNWFCSWGPTCTCCRMCYCYM